VWFGGCEIRRSAQFMVGDRATFASGHERLPIRETVHDAVEEWLARHLPRFRPHVVTIPTLALGSAQLRSIFQHDARESPSNDTSAASGYAPASPTEEIVLAVEQFLNGEDFKTRFPDTGEDVKVFGRREDDRVSLTVAMPLLSEAVPSEHVYFQRKEEILDVLIGQFRRAPLKLEWQLNNLDTSGRGSDGVYLTVTGTSAESADSGQVGRGNRANGLIAFSRPSGNEAAPGKNAMAHAGKIYSVLSHRLANQIHGGTEALVEVYVHLAARIGDPVDRPWVGVQIMLEDGGGPGGRRDRHQKHSRGGDGTAARVPRSPGARRLLGVLSDLLFSGGHSWHVLGRVLRSRAPCGQGPDVLEILESPFPAPVGFRERRVFGSEMRLDLVQARSQSRHLPGNVLDRALWDFRRDSIQQVCEVICEQSLHVVHRPTWPP
jgi:S-adenosylmethionine synthetase